MRRFLAVILTVILLTKVFPLSALGTAAMLPESTEGLCGEGEVEWKFTAVYGAETYYNLSISGKGKMPDYTQGSQQRAYEVASAANEIFILEGVTGIGNYAFEGFSALESVRIADTVVSLGEGCFSDCPKLKRIQYGGNHTAWECISADSGYDGCSVDVEFEENTITLLFKGNGGTVETPLKIVKPNEACGALPTPTREGDCFVGWFTADKGGDEVTEDTVFGEAKDVTLYAHWKSEEPEDVLYRKTEGDNIQWTFYVDGRLEIEGTGIVEALSTDEVEYKSVVTDVAVGEGITALGNFCFEDFENMKSITLPDGVTTFGEKCFCDCSVLETIQIPNSVKSLGKNCFAGCSHLTEISIPDDVTCLEEGCFAKCISLASIDIPDSVEEIGSYCFADCESLISVTIPNGTTDISEYCFLDCSGLESITLPCSVTKLEGSCFSGCSGLIRVEISDGVTSVDPSSFTGCEGLKNSPQSPTNGIRYGGKEEKWCALYSGEDVTAFCEDGIVNNSASYTVDFEPNGGTVSQISKNVLYGEPYGILPEPTREGYTFDGWFTSEEETKVTEDVLFVETGDTTLYAHWIKGEEQTENTYLVLFETEGGSVSPSSKSVSFGKPYGTLPEPTRKGYDFSGWYTKDGREITENTMYGEEEDTTLYAHWTAGAFLIIFEASGGSVGERNKTVFYGEPYGELPVPVWEGYLFRGWYTPEGIQVVAETVFDRVDDVTLSAEWESDTSCGEGVTYQISEDGILTVSGTGKMEDYPDVSDTPWVRELDTIHSVVIEVGVTYVGSHSFEGAAELTSVTLPKGTISIEETAFRGCKLKTVRKAVEAGQPIGNLPSPTKTGYEFLGWYDTEQNATEQTDIVRITAETISQTDAPLTLYGWWKPEAELSEGDETDSSGGSSGAGAIIALGAVAAVAVGVGLYFFLPVEVKGMVLTPSGIPAVNANVTLWQNGEPLAETVTNEIGLYQFNVKRGSYEIHISYLDLTTGQTVTKVQAIEAPVNDTRIDL